MSLNEDTLISLIKASGKVDETDLANAGKTAEHLSVSILEVLKGRSILTEADLGEILSEYFGKEYVNLSVADIKPEVLNLIPEDVAAEKNVIAFDKNENYVSIATADPKDLDLVETVKKIIGERKVKVFVSTPDEIRNAIKAYKLQKNKKEGAEPGVRSEESAVSLLNRIVDAAVREEASDIHIEPLEDMLLVRVRVDGVLHDEGAYPKESHQSLIARVKILSDLKLDEQRLPQDGQFSFKTKSGDKVSLRVSVSPTVYGEKAVLRILKSSHAHFNL